MHAQRPAIALHQNVEISSGLSRFDHTGRIAHHSRSPEPGPCSFPGFRIFWIGLFYRFFSAISRTTLVTLENKNRTAHCEATRSPSIPHALLIRAQHGQPAAFCVAKPCRPTSWLDGR